MWSIVLPSLRSGIVRPNRVASWQPCLLPQLLRACAAFPGPRTITTTSATSTTTRVPLASRTHPDLATALSPGATRTAYRFHGGGHHRVAPVPDVPSAGAPNSAAVRITRIGLWTNLGLSGGKAVIGVLCSSPALLADAIHSATDLISDFITIVTLKKASQPITSKHPYGQGKWEAVGALSCAALLLGSAGGLVYHSGEILFAHLFRASEALTSHHDALPLSWALGAAGVSIVVKELLYQSTIAIGRKAHSQVVIANGVLIFG